MAAIINEESVKIVSNKFFEVLNYTLPGIFTLEVFFKKGLFSNPPETLFDFILLLLWSFLFSLPFNIVDTFHSRFILNKVRREIKKKGDLRPEVELELKKLTEESAVIHHIANSTFQFLSIILHLLILYVFYKYLDSHYDYYSFWNIRVTLIIYFNTMLIFPIFATVFYFIGDRIAEKICKGMMAQIYSDK